MTQPVLEQVRSLSSDIFGIPTSQIDEASSPQNIESWDSIQHLSLVLALEERFHFQLTPEEIEQMTNIGQVVRLVEGKLQATAS